MRIAPYLCVLLLLPCGNGSLSQNSKENADFKLAVNLFNDGLYDLAAEQLKQFISSFPGSSNGGEARFYLGLTQMKLKLFDDARMTFQTFALTYQENPKAPDAWMNVGECYGAVGNPKEAALAFERVKVFHPRSKVAPEALVKASEYFKRAGQTEDARRVLRVALQEYATSNAALAARAQLGQLYFEEGNLVQAQNELKRVIDGDPSPEAKAQALLILGNIHQALGQIALAQSSYREIIDNYKASTAIPGAYLNLGKLLSGTGKRVEALENFKKALGQKTTDSTLAYEANTGIGECYQAMGETVDALAFYERAVLYAPSARESWNTLWMMATTAARGAHWTKSNDACNRILRLGADAQLKRKAAIRLALTAEARKDYVQAVQQYTAFLDQHPADPVADEIAFRLANLTEKELRDARKGAAYYEQFISRYARSTFIDDAYAGAARCYDALRETDRSAHLYRELLTRFPSTEFRPAAEERVRMMETFEVREKDAGVEKLALLMGDVVGEKDRIGLSYRLGEIYFNDLKNYAAAVAQFTNAINSGMRGGRFVDALYSRARSLEYLTWKDDKLVPQAIESFKTFLNSYPDEPRSEDAALSLFMLSASSLPAARSSYEATLATRPAFRKRDMMLQRIGSLQEQADSLAAALSTYDAIAREFSNSPILVEVAYRRFSILLRLGLNDLAIPEGTDYIKMFPNGPHTAEVTLRTANLLAQAGTHEKAAGLYRTLLSEFGYSTFAATAARKLADSHAATGQYDEAIAIYRELIAAHRDNPLVEQDVDASLLLAIGTTYQRAGNMKEAKDALVQVLARQAATEVAGEAYTALGRIAIREGNAELATSYFRQAGNIAPNSGASRDIANLLFDNAAYPDAIRQYVSLAQAATNDTDRQYYESQVIVARYRSNDLVSAEKEQSAFLKKYRNAEHDVASFELEKGLYHYRREDFVNARKSFDRVADKYDDSPSAPLALYWAGKVLESTRKLPEALKLYEQLMKSYPSSPVISRVHLALGNIYYTTEKWDESIRNYKLVMDNPASDPTLLPVAMSNLIETYETAGIFDAALQLTRKYLEQYPDNDDSFDKRIKIGILYQRLGYNDQSALHLQTLLDEAGSDLEGEIRYYIAEANYNKGDYQQAILDFLKVPYLVTKKGKMDWTANSLYMAGQSYEKMGRYDQSLTMYRQILDRPGIDETFKAAARKEIDRVKLVLKKPGSK